MAFNHRWQFLNPSSGVSMRFPINPKEGALPSREKNVNLGTQPTNPYANPIIIEGRESPAKFAFSGTIISQAHYQFMVNWYNSPVSCRIIDDLGQTFWVYLTKFDPKRKNRHSHAWAMDYTAEGVITG